MNRKQMLIATLLVGVAGGQVEAVSPDGIVQFAIGLEPGEHKGARIAKYMGPEDEARFTEGVTAMLPEGNRAARMKYGPGGAESGANPDYRPSSAATQQKYLARTVAKLTAKSDSLDRRIAAHDRLKKLSDEKEAAEAKAKADAEAAKAEAEAKAKADAEAAAQAEADKEAAT